MASSPLNTCTCHVCLGIKTIIDSILKLLKVYGWILDSYIIDFFQDDLWNKLPKSWTETLEIVPLEELGSWILGESREKHVWPLSLIALRKLLTLLTINRDPENKSPFICNFTDRNNHFLNSTNNQRILPDERLKKFQNLFKKHVKEKKLYEIEKFSKIIAKNRYLSNCNCVVDTGAGMGHLARELSYKYNLNVICIEQNKLLSDLAIDYDFQFMKKINKYLPDFSAKSPYHLCRKIIDENCKNNSLIIEIDEIMKNKFSLKSNNGYGLIGLHPCGDLAATLLKIYVKQENAKFINVVGCCYMKLTVKNDENGNALGYPLSKYLLNNNNNSLSYAALEVSCHAVENYCDKIKNNDYNDLKVHSYRATLEKLIIKKSGITMKHGKIGSVKVNDHMTFEMYCKLATEKLDVNRQINLSEINHAEVSKCLAKWRHVVAFEGLRIMLAPIIETLILLDRFLYLSDNGLKPMLKAEFDPRLSPRNFVLSSIK